MTQNTRRRLYILLTSIIALFVTSWLELFLQRKQYLIGAGINRVFLFLLINLHVVIIIILLYIIIRQSIKLFVELHRKTAGSAFKKNLLFAFTVFSVIPTVLVFFTAGKLITTSIDNWFAARIETGLKNSLTLHEQQTKKTRVEIKNNGQLLFEKLTSGNLLNEPINNAVRLKENVIQIINIQPELKNYKTYIWQEKGDEFIGSLSEEANIWREFRKLNDRSTKSLKAKFLKIIYNPIKDTQIFDFYGSLYFVKRIASNPENPKTSLTDLNANKNKYLVLAHRYENNIRYPLIEIQNSISDYEQLKSMHNPIYWNYLFTFILVTLLILFLSIWCAFYLAKGISKPIQELLKATEKIRRGSWDVEVAYDPNSDLKNLAIGFNEMTKALQQAQTQLENKNKEMLMILENIKGAVFFVNKFGRILTYNNASKELVEKYLEVTRFKNKKITFFGNQVALALFKLVRKLISSGKQQLTKEIMFTFKSEPKTFLIHLTHINNYSTKPNFKQPKQNRLLVVVEDLTDIVKINQIKTWQQAAKQMAHEIKNPLTPIQLATQRLQRKFRKNLNDDKIFLECTDTILNHVKIIKDLVSHFSEFSKMPSSKIEPLDINNVIKDVSMLYEHSYPEIEFIYELEEFIPLLKIDKQKIKRVIINLLNNSVRALKHMNKKNAITISTSFKTGRNQIELIIADNGPGIPDLVKNKLFLPYVSSEKKNMGLGLAIVHESVTQVGGSIKLLPSYHGAIFQMLFPV